MSRIERLIERWPSCLIFVGLLLFWLACACGDRLPVEALLVGPAAMFAGIVAGEYNKRQ